MCCNCNSNCGCGSGGNTRSGFGSCSSCGACSGSRSGSGCGCNSCCNNCCNNWPGLLNLFSCCNNSWNNSRSSCNSCNSWWNSYYAAQYALSSGCSGCGNSRSGCNSCGCPGPASTGGSGTGGGCGKFFPSRPRPLTKNKRPARAFCAGGFILIGKIMPRGFV